MIFLEIALELEEVVGSKLTLVERMESLAEECCKLLLVGFLQELAGKPVLSKSYLILLEILYMFSVQERQTLVGPKS